MCGLAGFVSTMGFTRDELTDHAGRMIAPIAHRGPDDSAVWLDERAGVALGFRRLAILDLSPLGRQPMTSATGRFVMAFNGEVYNFAGLRRDLEQHGHRFRGRSDTEVILAAFEEWGIAGAVRTFVGMFAMAVWDAERRELSLIRDRLGKKPLYVYSEPGLVTFGSELKALAAGPSFDRALDPSALLAYFRYLYIPAPKTIFARAMKVPAAGILTIRDPDAPLPDARRYWSIQDAAAQGLAEPVEGSETETLDALDRLLADAVRCRLQSDVPLGALLSGGIDSSLVVALMQEAAPQPVRTYTIGFAEEEFNEAGHAARVARHIGTDHTELQLTAHDAHSLVPRMAEIFDEPLADPSQLPTYLVSRLARHDVTVALCGDGGDELFGGYNRYVYGTRVLKRVERIPRALRRPFGAGICAVPAPAWGRMHRLAATVLPGVPDGHFGERVHKVGTLLHAGSEGGMYRSLVSAWQQPEQLLAPGALLDVEADDNPTARILDDSTLPDLLDRMMLADQTTYLPDDLLAKVDRASMAVSLEVRAPLLDHRVAEFSWRLPRAMKIRGTVGKWALRQLLYRRVPQHIVDRPKMGFSVPIDQWLRGPLREWADSLLSTAALRRSGVLNDVEVRAAWCELHEQRRPAGAALWSVIMFQAWQERWLPA